MDEVWKWISFTLGGVVIAEGGALWALTTALNRINISVKERPTFSQVSEMIERYEDASAYSKDARWIKEKFETIDTHVKEVRADVKDILLDIEAQRRIRAQQAVVKE